ncbi:MAG TPA: hypothetical protein VIF62_14485 [Labilithrix sp.]
MIAIPRLPEGDEPYGTAELFPRYEDITQDGRIAVTALMSGIGASAWRAMQGKVDATAFGREGILPILRRVVLVGEPGPISVNAKIAYSGTWRFAREKGGERLFLNMWMEARAPIGTSYGPPLPPDAPRVVVGRVFAEHVVTKPFASSPAERKVTRLPAGTGLPEIPSLEHAFEPAEALVADAKLDEIGDAQFGMMHTDSNQHVNSLVYPRVFQEALVRQVEDPKLLARAIEMRWRKPFFAGDRAILRACQRGASWVGTFAPPGADKISCAIAATLG